MLGTTFYNQSIRKVLVAFGTLFNNISIDRDDGTTITRVKIPLSYAPRARFIQRLNQEGQSDPELEITLPRMAFEWTDLSFDSTRKLNTMQKTGIVGSTGSGYVEYRWQRVPYDLTIGLAIVARTTEDGLKIIEQILPYFTPEFNVTVNDVIKTDIPVVLSSVSQDDMWEGGLVEERRLITWTLDFSLKTYLYGPSLESKIVTEAITQMYVNQDMNIADLTFNLASSTGDFRVDELAYQGNSYDSRVASGKVLSWDSSTRVLRITDIEGVFEINKRVYGGSTMANWVLNTYSNVYQDVQTALDSASVRMTTVPDPSDADADDDYIASTTIDEFP